MQQQQGTGTVQFLEPSRGFFFIRQDPPSDGSDLFGHATAMAQDGDTTFLDLSVGDRVAYDIVPSRTKPGKMQATNIRVLN